MEKTLNIGAFEAIDANEMMAIDGGWTWKGLAAAMGSGALCGAGLGAAAGGVGAGPGAIGGALTGGIAYLITDLAG